MKLVLRAVAVLVLLLVVLLIVTVVFVDDVVKTAVERGGTYALGVETTLEGADIGLFSGNFGLKKFEIDNPPGFEKPNFLTLSEAELDVEVGSLLSDTLVVPRILIAGVTLDIVQNDQGTNYGVIMENLERLKTEGEGAEEPGGEEPPRSGGPGKKILLREVIVRDVRVTANIDTKIAGQKEFTYTLPELVLTEFGNDDEARPVAEQVSLIVQGLLAAALESGRQMLPDDLLKDLDLKLDELKGKLPEMLPEGTPEELKKEIEKVLDGAGVQLDGVGTDLGKTVDDAAKKAQDAVKGVDVQGLLGGKKKGGS